MASEDFLWVVASVFIVGVAGNTCVCNKDETYQSAIFSSTQLNSVIGYLSPHQCRIYMNTSNTNGNRLAVQYTNEIGYVANNADFILVADCPGTHSDSGLLATALPLTPSMIPRFTPSAPGCTEQRISSDLTGNVSLCPRYVREVAKSHCHLLTQHGRKCYEMSTGRVSWTHSNQTCAERGGYLVTIHIARHNTYLHSLLMELHYTGHVWIGLHDRDKEGHYQWVTGEKLSYTNWSHHAKNSALPGHQKQDCVVMLPSGEWEDVKCGGDDATSEATATRNAYICEYIYYGLLSEDKTC